MLDVRSLPSLAALPDEAALRWPDRPALCRAQSGDAAGSAVTFSGFRDAARRRAAAMRADGLRPGERVVLFMEPGPEWTITLFALWRAGLTVVPLPAETPPERISDAFRFVDGRAIAVSARTRSRIPPGIPSLPCGHDGAGAPAEDRAEDPLETALIAFTSGSTAHPRAVVLTQDNLLANLTGLLTARTTSPESRFLSVLPPSHLFELMVGHLGPLACGAAVVYAGSLLPNRLLDAIRDERITHLLAVPGLVRALYEALVPGLREEGAAPPDGLSAAGIIEWLESGASAEERERFRLGVRRQLGDPFESLVVGGAASGRHWPAVAAALGIRYQTGYGLTEASPVVTLGDAAESPPGSVGRPLPNVDVTVSGEGEILVRGPSVMTGYLGDPGATATAIEDGWLHTGDRGRLDDSGHLFIQGRIKEAMVTSSGETIYPEEVEPHYRCDGTFAEWCVVPLVDEEGNDRPVLVVVPAPDCGGAEALESAFRRLRAAAPPRLRITRMIPLDQPLPRTPSGKVPRRLLAHRLQAAAENAALSPSTSS